MGTNYYAKIDECGHCGRGQEALHIGKSSAGWAFSLRVHPELSINDWSDWKIFLIGKAITDEYGSRVSFSDLEDTVIRRKIKIDNLEKFKDLAASMEPYCLADIDNGLLRHVSLDNQVFNPHVTYDICDYEFN